jgi:hypothetical protein
MSIKEFWKLKRPSNSSGIRIELMVSHTDFVSQIREIPRSGILSSIPLHLHPSCNISLLIHQQPPLLHFFTDFFSLYLGPRNKLLNRLKRRKNTPARRESTFRDYCASFAVTVLRVRASFALSRHRQHHRLQIGTQIGTIESID